jgi:mannose-6-phosphate isomerase
VKPTPTRIDPIFSPRIWGARSLAPFFPEKQNLAEPLGEAWLTGLECRIATGPFSGKTLEAAWQEMDVEWRGTGFSSGDVFPILVKFIFPNDRLSIQVHPDDAYAEKHEKTAGGRGKTEMWHAVAAEPNASVLIGLKPGVDKQKFLAGLASKTVESLFDVHPVRVGDTFFLPAGTPHAIFPGAVFCEVQEYSDLTYRAYDYDRVDAEGKPRELHLQKSLDVMHFGRTDGGPVPGVAVPGGNSHRKLLAACRYFATERWDIRDRITLVVDESRFELIVVLQGAGTLAWPGSAARIRRGECWLIPAGLASVDVVPEEPVTIIRTYVPNVARLRTELHREGLSAAAIAQAVFD